MPEDDYYDGDANGGNENSIELDSELVAKIMQTVFDCFVAESNLTVEQRIEAQPQAFISWLGTKDDVLFSAELCDDHPDFQNTPELMFCLHLPHDAGGLSRVANMWPYLVLNDRTTVHKLKAVKVAVMLLWEDGTFAPMLMLANQSSTITPLNDAAVAHVIMSQPVALAKAVIRNSLDSIHDNGQRGALNHCIDALDVLTTLVDELFTVNPDRVSPKHKVNIANLLLFLRQIVSPEAVVDPVPMAELAAKIRAANAKAVSGQREFYSSEFGEDFEDGSAGKPLSGGWEIH
jgi:hypothetical protein